MNRSFLLFFILLQCGMSYRHAYAQDNVGASFVFLTWHPDGDKMAFLQPNKLDPDATLVLNWGTVLHYERFIYRKRWSIKVAQAAYSDCARLFAGHTHIGFRYNFLRSEKHALRFGFGPTFVYRQSWHRFPGYEQQNRYLKTGGSWQYAFVWYGGELEYDYTIHDRWNVNLHVIPGLPDFFNFGIGIRYWIRPVPGGKYWKTSPVNNKWFYSRKDLQPGDQK